MKDNLEEVSVVKQKGQVTIPLVIRRLMNLEIGDNVIFNYNDGKVEITKDDGVDERVINILRLLVEKKLPIVIHGRLGSGKTYFVTELVKRVIESDFTIVEPLYNGIAPALMELELENASFTTELNEDSEYNETVIIDEANKYPVSAHISPGKSLEGKQLVLVYQDLKQKPVINKFVSIKINGEVQEISVVDGIEDSNTIYYSDR